MEQMFWQALAVLWVTGGVCAIMIVWAVLYMDLIDGCQLWEERTKVREVDQLRQYTFNRGRTYVEGKDGLLSGGIQPC